MTCEEFQLATLHEGSEDRKQQASREHVLHCPECAAFERNWQELRGELHEIGLRDQDMQAPSRVEMRLRQEFRTKHKTMKARRSAMATAWALAAAAVLIVTIGWVNWNREKNNSLADRTQPADETVSSRSSTRVPAAGPEFGEVLLASNTSEDFTLLPASTPGLLGDATVVHVQMQRGALGALGLTVNEEHAGDWIDVDLLVGDDGQPQAVRLPQSTN